MPLSHLTPTSELLTLLGVCTLIFVKWAGKPGNCGASVSGGPGFCVKCNGNVGNCGGAATAASAAAETAGTMEGCTR